MNNKQSIFIDPVAVKDNIMIISHDISSLKQYLRDHPKELYATPQMLDEEIPKSIIVLRTMTKHKESLITMLNPQILERTDKMAVEETQAQVEGTYLNIRHPKITVAYLALPKAVPTHIVLQGKAALMFQQAYSLLQGIPISLLGLRIDNYDEYQNGTDEEKQQIIEIYIKNLKQILDESKDDKEVSDYLAASEFVSDKIQRSVNEEIQQMRESAEEASSETSESNSDNSGADDGSL